ncbi:MAG: hypothetical protein ACE147_06880 [Candidatus Methylomirabilales bacterium]
MPLTWAVAALLLLAVAPAAAQAQISLRAQVIYASNQAGGVDGRLSGLSAELQTFRYSSYKLLQELRGSAALNQTWRSGLPGGRRLEVTPTAMQGGQATLAIRVLAGGQAVLNTSVRLRSGGPPVLVGGFRHDEGFLIIALSAS